MGRHRSSARRRGAATAPLARAGAGAAALLASAALIASAPAHALADVAPSWQPPIDLVSNGDVQQETVAMGASGDVLAAWGQDGDVYASLKTPGSPFETPIDLTPGSSGGEPAAAVDADGGGFVTWSSSDGAGVPPSVVRAALRQPGAPGFDAPVQLSTPSTDAGSVTAAGNADGDGVVSWLETTDDGVTYAIRAALREGGGAFAPAVTIADGLGSTPPAGHAAIDADGVATIVWTDGTDVSAATSQADGSFALSVVSGAPVSPDELNPSVAVAPGGETVVAWQRGLVSRGVFAAVRPVGSSAFGSPVELSPGGQRAINPSATIAADGSAVVAWRVGGGASTPIWQASRPAGGSFTAGSGTELSAADASANSLVSATSGDGTAFVAYNGLFEGLIGYARPAGDAAFGAGTTLGDPDGFVFSQSLAAGGGGDAALEWIDFEDGFNLRVRGYDASPPRVYAFDVPAAGVAGPETVFSIDARDVWSETTTSWSFGDGATATGATVAHAYTEPGSYTVTAVARDADGRSVERSARIAVEASPSPPVGRPNPPEPTPPVPPAPPVTPTVPTPPAPPASPPPARRAPRPHGSVSLAGGRAIAGADGTLRLGCRLTRGALRTCTVTLSGDGPLGGGSARPGSRTRAATVEVRLNRRARERIAAALGGVRARVTIVAVTRSGQRLRSTASVRLFAARQRVVTQLGAFAGDSSALTPTGTRFLRGVARALRGASAIVCTGFTASVSGDVAAARRLGLERGRSACDALRRFGVRVRLTAASGGHSDRLADNDTEAGRARNRRVELTIVRK